MNSIAAWRILALAVLVLLASTGNASAAPGDLDRSFGHDGTVVREFGATEDIYATAVTPNGKVVVAGYAYVRGLTRPVVARFGRSGRLNRAFGRGGKLFIDPPGADVDGGWISDIEAVAGGKMLVALTVSHFRGLYEFAVARLTRRGRLDDGFGTNGLITGRFAEGVPSSPGGMAVTAEGKILLAGGAGGDLGIARLTPEGELDSGFGGDGTVTTDLGGVDRATDVAVTDDGAAVVSGRTGQDVLPGDPDGWNVDLVVARYLPTGDLDPEFADDGVQTWGPSGPEEHASAVSLLDGGGIVAAGWTTDSRTRALLIRLRPGGDPKRSFGHRGGRIVELGGRHGVSDVAADLAIEDGNRIVLGGWAEDRRGKRSFAVARLRLSGTFDREFGAGGRVRTSIGNRAMARALALAPNRIVVAGSRKHNDTDTAIARYRSG